LINLSFLKDSTYEIGITAVYIINFLVSLNLVFREKRSIETTVAWILILSTIPALGFILYICFGRGISKDNMFKIKEAEDKIIKNNILDTHVKLDYPNKFDPTVVDHRDMIYALANSNNAHFTDNNTVDIYAQCNGFFDSLLDELKQAKQYINIQFYIFKDDDIGSKIIDIGPGHIMIDYPTHIKTGRTSFFLDGTKLSISFVDKLKNIYKFNTEVSGRRMDGVPMLKISYSGDQQLIKVQRREYVRIQTELDVSVLKDGKYTQLVTTDISAGGIKLNLSVANFNEKDSLSLIIVLPF